MSTASPTVRFTSIAGILLRCREPPLRDKAGSEAHAALTSVALRQAQAETSRGARMSSPIPTPDTPHLCSADHLATLENVFCIVSGASQV